METRQLARSEWTTLFDSLSRIYGGSTASLEILDDSAGAQLEIETPPSRVHWGGGVNRETNHPRFVAIRTTRSIALRQ